MKTYNFNFVLIFLFCLNPNFGFSQTETNESGHFKFDEKERKIEYLEVFEIDSLITFSDLTKYFVENQIIEIISQDSTSLKGKFIPTPIDIQKYGYKRGLTPMVLLDVEQVFNVEIEYKTGKYRAILSNMGYIDNGVISDLVSRSLVGQTSTTAKGNLESYNGDFSFTKKNEIRKSISGILEVLEKFYADVLQIKLESKVKGDW
jgi:hypothetical protein